MTPPFRLTTLGALDVSDSSGTRADPLAAQQKRLALLVFLAVEGVRGPVSRDLVSTVFWPRRDQDRARANLRNTLHFLRSHLGYDAIVVIGDERIQLDPEFVRCDAAEALLSGIRPGGGVFMDGVHFRGAGTDFYDWVDRVRTRLEALPVGPVASSAGSTETEAGTEGVEEVPFETSPHDGEPSRTSPGLRSWRRPASAAGIILIAGLAMGQVAGWRPGSSSEEAARGDAVGAGLTSAGSEVIREIDPSERALVFPFEMSGDSTALQEVADVGSSWILRRIGSSGVAGIVSYGSLQALLGPPARVDLSEAADSALTDFIVLGRIVATGGKVTVEPRVVRAADLSEIPLSPETATLDRAVEALDGAAERIIAALAAEMSPTWRWPPFSPPPSLEILQVEKRAHDAFYALEYDRFHALADSAMSMDTAYTSFPMLNLKASAYWNQRRVDPRNMAWSDSTLAYMEGLGGRLSPSEQRGVQWLRGILAGDLLSEFEAVDPGTGAADRVPYRVAMTSRRMNRLGLARELIVKRYLMHPRGANYVAWDEVHLATLARLREYEALREAAVEAQGREPQYGLFVLREAQALAGLDEPESMEEVISLARAQPVSTEFNPVVHMASAASVALAEGHEESARRYANRALELSTEPQYADVDLRRAVAEVYGVLGDWEAAILALEDFAAREAAPEIRIEGLGLYGAALAAAGRQGEARAVLNDLHAIADEYERFYIFGVAQWHQARIHARLGESDEAIRLLGSALQRGQVHDTWEIWDIHWLLLRGDPRYEDLTRIRS